ncbi:MAG: L-arabinose isomerase family protein [Armatimonadota bacterium]
MRSPQIGLLPLYIALYDTAVPEARKNVEAFYAQVADALRARGLEVATAPTCRLQPEFAAAVKGFEEAGVDAIITLHLAYSPSLESAAVLAGTALPLIVLDTTPTYRFGADVDPAEIMGNHGIHGVQDMCNLLIRNGKPFQIEAGHWEKSDVLDRVAGWAKAAQVASAMRHARVGLAGEAFKGMGDFAVPFDVMQSTIGIETVPLDPQVLQSLVPAEDDPAVAEEMVSDLQAFTVQDLDSDVHRRSVRAGLALRRWISQERLSAVTVNFLDVDAVGLPTMPFLEISKGMARGIGFGGEGDVLTAALVGALASVYPQTSFTEMFCPDWEGGSVFMSHMGEMNLDLVDGKPLLTNKAFPWSNAGQPAVAAGRFKGGDAVLVNLAPGPDWTYTLVICPGEMLDIKQDRMKDTIRGWFKPALPLNDFLAAYSALGGTHHSAVVYGDVTEDLIRFGEVMGWDVAVLCE